MVHLFWMKEVCKLLSRQLAIIVLVMKARTETVLIEAVFNSITTIAM